MAEVNGGDDVEVKAAGGVIHRTTKAGAIEVVVVHRPRYDDWSLPKGKVDGDETDEECARREVEEETGFRCRLGAELASTEYADRKGRSKRVRYWLMEVDGGEFTPNHEVDELRWIQLEEAGALLSYDHDVALVKALAGRFHPPSM